MQEEQVKVLFRFYSDILEDVAVETMWTTIVDKEQGLYKLNNIPFYAQSLAAGDVILAEHDNDEACLIFREVVQYSGNSTIHIVAMNDAVDMNELGDELEKLGCNWEGMKNNYLAVEVPAGVDYMPVKQRLDEIENEGVISYAESCLAEAHRY